MKTLLPMMALTLAIPSFADLSGDEQAVETCKQLKSQIESKSAELDASKAKSVQTIKNLKASLSQMELVLASAETPNAPQTQVAPSESARKILVDLKLDKEEDLKEFKVNRFIDLNYCSLQEFPDGGAAFLLEIPDAAKAKDAKLFYWFDLPQIDGKRIICSAKIKGEGIVPANNGGNGGVFNLCATKPDGKSIWPGAQIGNGTFDWKTVSFTADIPRGVKSCFLMIGLQGANAGKIWFRDLKVEVEE